MRFPAAVARYLFFNDTALTEIYTLSLHDALPISRRYGVTLIAAVPDAPWNVAAIVRSEEHTSELQSHSELVCRLLLEKKKQSVALALFDESTDSLVLRLMADGAKPAAPDSQHPLM